MFAGVAVILVMMPPLDKILKAASGREREYDWKGATESYMNALSTVPEDTPEKAAITEKQGYAFYRFATQSEKKEEFKERIREAIASYRTAGDLFNKLDHRSAALRCEAFLYYLGYWTTSLPSQKNRALLKSWDLAKEAMKCFDEAGDSTGFGETYTQLSITALLRFFFECSHLTREEMFREAIELGEHSIALAKDVDNPVLLAKAYLHTAAFLAYFSDLLSSNNEIQTASEKMRHYRMEAQKLDNETMLSDYVSLSAGLDLGEGPAFDNEISLLKESLRQAESSKDKLAAGWAFDWLAHHTGQKVYLGTTSEESVDLCQAAYEFANKAQACFQTLNFTSPRGALLWVGSPETEYYTILSLYQIDPSNRRELLQKAVKATPDVLRTAKQSGFPSLMQYAHHVASKAFLLLSKTETGPENKKQLLETAKRHRRESIRITKILESWQRYLFLDISYMADITSQLAEVTEDAQTKTRLLYEAVREKGTSLELLHGNKSLWQIVRYPQYYWFQYGRISSERGVLQTRLFDLTGSKESQEAAASSFSNAAQSFRQLNQTSRVAECFRRAAQACDALEKYQQASEKFRQAATSYRSAAEQIVPLGKFYLDQSSYMEVWASIEEARSNHASGEYRLAAESYNSAGNLCNLSEKRKYLSPGYRALAQLEIALDKSKKELNEEAEAAFKEASRLFLESRVGIEAHASRSEDPEEARETEAFIHASFLRERYCIARAEVEQARILNMKGEHRTSAGKYGRAIEALQEMARDSPSEIDRNEVNATITLARAFQMMAKAEAEASPKLYRTASELFEQAKISFSSEADRRLVLGHSRYCRALEIAARFLDSGRDSDYRAATQRLSSASAYYTTAGFHNASEYTKATKHLLDAHMYIHRANREQDQRKKIHIHGTVEELLRAAADSFGEAGYTAKKEETLRLLESVREEKELAISLDDHLTGESLGSETNLTHSVLARGDPVGTERFLGAYVMANVIPSSTQLKLGESLGLKIEISNAGMKPAQLLRVERGIPDGFDVLKKPEQIQVVKKHLILKGRRLEPLKTEELNLTLKAMSAGPFALEPRILYIDEEGRSLSHEPEPLEVRVQDPIFQEDPALETATSLNSPVTKFLTDAFVADYMRKRLSIQHAGWRGLPEIVSSLKIPKSQVYGDARYRHTFGRPLEKLVKAGIVEFRIFPGSRGRGGNIVKVRVSYEKEPVKRFVDSIALTPLASESTQAN